MERSEFAVSVDVAVAVAFAVAVAVDVDVVETDDVPKFNANWNNWCAVD